MEKPGNERAHYYTISGSQRKSNDAWKQENEDLRYNNSWDTAKAV